MRNERMWLMSGLLLFLGAEALADEPCDIYSIENPTQALAAVRAKWTGVDETLSQWKRPAQTDYYLNLEAGQDWCAKDPKGRCEQFERVALDGIKSKLDPPRWYYNLACAKALQGKREEAFTALEQSVAAGPGDPEHAMEDSDLASLTNDVRFAKLCAMMRADERTNGSSPRENACPKDGELMLSESTVYYDFEEQAFEVDLDSDADCPIVFINHLDGPSGAPCEGLINLSFPEESGSLALVAGPGNVFVRDVNKLDQDGDLLPCPVIVASDWLGSDDTLNAAGGVPQHLAVVIDEGWREFRIAEKNVLGIYATGKAFGKDGVDRLMGYYPMAVAHEGGAEESVKFVRLAAEMIRAMPADRRHEASLVIPWLLRKSQRCIRTDAEFLAGLAQRPILRFSDLDAEKAVRLAAEIGPEREEYAPPLLDVRNSRMDFDVHKVTDLWDSPYDVWASASSPWHLAFMARTGEKTIALEMAVVSQPESKVFWRLLQGEADKVRIEEKEGGSARIAVDYHEPFMTQLPGNREFRTSRVDVGAFKVQRGITSTPSIVSFYFMPNAKRVYGANGLLESIDYRQRQYETWCPRFCPKGDWKDVFHWTPEGDLMGWTRTYADDLFHWTTNEFTREGLVIDSRDALGRPKDVHRSLRSTWLQDLEPTNLVSDVLLRELPWLGKKYDEDRRPPAETTLAWTYDYKDDADRFGTPRPKEPKSFSYRPELCRRADFCDSACGFRLPLADQMELGYDVYAGYKHDLIFENVADLKREDSAYLLKNQGLVPPKELKKMRFCPFKPSTNDLWQIDTSAYEQTIASELVELADGAYRLRDSQPEGDQEPVHLSVSDTYRWMNATEDIAAYKLLDAKYRRCTEAEIKCVGNGYLNPDVLSVAVFIEEDRPERLPKGKMCALTMWEVRPGLYLLEHAWPLMPKGERYYVMIKYDVQKKRSITFDRFRDVPSYAIGNTMLRVESGDSEAINNFGVLFYEGIANADHYEEGAVILLLQRAATAGCALAEYNLGVLYYNRGEPEEAAPHFKAAKDAGIDF